MRREAVLVMQVEIEVSQRRACGLIEVQRSSCRYRRRRNEDPRLRARLRELAEVRRRFGYRRLQVLLQREGWRVNHKRVYRLYVEEKLGLRRKRGRKRSGARQPLAEPTGANQTWSVDFMTDALSSGRRFRTLNIGRRLHARSPGHRGGHFAEWSAGNAGTGKSEDAARAARTDPLRQRAGVHQPGAGPVGVRTRNPVALYPTRTTHGERIRGEFQWALAGRVPQ